MGVIHKRWHNGNPDRIEVAGNDIFASIMMLIYSENRKTAWAHNIESQLPVGNLVSHYVWEVVSLWLHGFYFAHHTPWPEQRQDHGRELHTLREFHKIISILTGKLMALAQWVITVLMDLSSAVLQQQSTKQP
jgi:hypothetical protein